MEKFHVERQSDRQGYRMIGHVMHLTQVLSDDGNQYYTQAATHAIDQSLQVSE